MCIIDIPHSNLVTHLLLLSFAFGTFQKFVTAATAIFHAAEHIVGWATGQRPILGSGIWGGINTVAIWIKKIVDFVNEHYAVIREWVVKHVQGLLQELYKHFRQEWLEKLFAKYEDIRNYYQEWRNLIDVKIASIVATLFPQMWKDFQTIMSMLYDLAMIISAISDAAAKWITELTRKIEDVVYKRLNNIENWKAGIIDTFFGPFDKFFGTVDEFKRDHWDPLVEGTRRLKEDLGLIVDDKGNVVEEFAWNSGSLWGKQLYNKFLGNTKHWEAIVEVMPPEELKVYKEIHSIAEQAEIEMPEEEKEIADALEAHVLSEEEIG